jgi:two-component system, response regulator PdtaR
MNSPRKRTILVVDDDRLVLATLAHGLAQAGYDVIDADNGDDAILLAREHQPDLALLDIRMQGKSGFDVAAYLRDSSRVPFMFLSAFADAETAAQVEALGAVAYLTKPLDIGQILPVVDAVFAHLPAPAARPVEPAEPVPDVMIAVGVVMQRDQLSRVAAYRRLAHAAAADGQTLAEYAARMLDAIEQPASPEGA